jgi:hypothetical protein
MSELPKKPEFLDTSVFDKNRPNFPDEELVPYYGKFVAWSPDGLRIVASGDDREAVWRELEAKGIDFNRVVGEFIPPPDMVILY